MGLWSTIKDRVETGYKAADLTAGGFLPGGVSRREAVFLQEKATRWAADRVGLNPEGRLTDFAVGAQRIAGGQVGQGDNPSFRDVLTDPDHGTFPAAAQRAADALPDWEDAKPWLIGAAVLLGAAVLRR